MHRNLSYEEKCACERSNFCTFVYDYHNFSDEDKQHLVLAIVGDRMSGLLYVSGALAGWSFVAGIIDSVLFPGILIYALVHGVVDYKVLVPPLSFLILNLMAKLTYIVYNLYGKIRLYDIVIAAFPYVGSAYLLKKFIVNDKVLSKAIYMYLKMKKKEVKQKIFSFLRINNKVNSKD